MAKKFRLKDQETGFHDPQTHLDITRDDEVEIDTKKGAGRATMRAIKSGGLIEVGRSSKADASEEVDAGEAASKKTTSTRGKGSK